MKAVEVPKYGPAQAGLRLGTNPPAGLRPVRLRAELESPAKPAPAAEICPSCGSKKNPL
jgi:hypothetical protein